MRFRLFFRSCRHRHDVPRTITADESPYAQVTTRYANGLGEIFQASSIPCRRCGTLVGRFDKDYPFILPSAKASKRPPQGDPACWRAGCQESPIVVWTRSSGYDIGACPTHGGREITEEHRGVAETIKSIGGPGSEQWT